jgi:hypothetical protein
LDVHCRSEQAGIATRPLFARHPYPLSPLLLLVNTSWLRQRPATRVVPVVLRATGLGERTCAAPGASGGCLPGEASRPNPMPARARARAAVAPYALGLGAWGLVLAFAYWFAAAAPPGVACPRARRGRDLVARCHGRRRRPLLPRGFLPRRSWWPCARFG